MALRTAAFLIAISSVLSAQPANNIKADTPQARAILLIAEPHHPLALPENSLNRVLVFLDAGQMIFPSSAGTPERIAFQAGDIRWAPARQSFTVENAADQPLKLVEVELKNKPPRPPMPVSPLDPTVVDSSHYKVAFENDQVRVLRVRYGAHEGGNRHEHILNRVVCYITDQGNGKAGEVHVSGAMTHSEDNKLDQPVERIAVELK